MRSSATLLFALVLLVPIARAQTPGTCALGTAQNELDVSDVFARVFNTGSLFFGNMTTAGNGYLVPFSTGNSPIFAAGIWVGGKVNGELRVAAARYTRFEFRPGPLDPGAALPEADCRRTNAHGREAWDRIYVVSVLDVEQYEQDGTVTDDLEDWPVGLGAPAVDAGGDPVVPTNRDQLLDLDAGERPVTYGSQTAFWVMNDVGAAHEETGSAPIGLEVQVLAYAIADAEDAFNQGTFYRYRLINRNDAPFEEARFSLFTDQDLGDAVDDVSGVDTTRSMAVTYNGDDDDAEYGIPPALGIDLLGTGAAAGTSFCGGCTQPGTTDPRTKEEYYNHMQGRWKDGTPITEGGSGYETPGPETTYMWPGDPVTAQCWSPENDCLGGSIPPNDQRYIIHTPAFALQPGEAMDVHVAILFARGDDRLDSVVELRAASDRVQAAFDDGTLFDRGAVLTTLPAPTLSSPAEGAVLTQGDVTFAWSAVPGAESYVLQIGTSADFENPQVYGAAETSLTIPERDFPSNREEPLYWRVRALGSGAVGLFSESRSFVYYRFVGEWAGDGAGIVETAYPGVPDVCAGAPADPGCAEYGGNTVWHDANSNADYYVSAGGLPGDLFRLSRYIGTAVPDDFEIRFTEEGGYGVYAFSTTAPFLITRVPFEIWNVGNPDIPDDDVRMIPFINESGTPQTDWADSFTGTDPWPESPCPGGCPITDWVYWMMPDRPEGYDLFEQAALAFGGAGATYDTTGTVDGDTQVDTNPVTGEACGNQGAYVDWCYKLDRVDPGLQALEFVYPIGRLVFADLAGDGTTPPTGTTARFILTDPAIIASEPGGPVAEVPEAYALGAAYPNPFNPRAVVPFALPRAADVRVTVYDVLGREVAVLVDGRLPAGAHEAVLDGRWLASGLYIVTLQAEGARRAHRTVTLLR